MMRILYDTVSRRLGSLLCPKRGYGPHGPLCTNQACELPQRICRLIISAGITCQGRVGSAWAVSNRIVPSHAHVRQRKPHVGLRSRRLTWLLEARVSTTTLQCLEVPSRLDSLLSEQLLGIPSKRIIRTTSENFGASNCR